MAKNVLVKHGGALEIKANISRADVSWINKAVLSKVPEAINFCLTEKIAYLGKIK